MEYVDLFQVGTAFHMELNYQKGLWFLNAAPFHVKYIAVS